MDIGGAVNTTSDKYLWVTEAVAVGFAILFATILIIGITVFIKNIVQESKKNKK